jgi:hypothetical protein
VLAAAPFKWAALLGAQATVPHFLEEFAAKAAAPSAPSTAAGTPAAAGSRFAALSGADRRQQLMSEVSGVIANLLGTGKPGHLQPELHMLGIAFLQKGLKDVLLKWQEVAPIWVPALHYHERPAAWACCVARSLLLTYVHLTHLFIYLFIY